MKLEHAYYIAGVGVFVLMLLSALGIDLKRWTRMPVAMNSNAGLAILAAIGITLTSWGLYRSYTAGFKDWADEDHPIADRTFRNEAVEIDGKVFRHCTFENVSFVYKARQSFKIQNCTFIGKRMIRAASPEVEATVLLLRGLGVNPVDAPLYSDKPLPMVDPGPTSKGPSIKN